MRWDGRKCESERERGQSGEVEERIGGTEVSQAQSPPQFGQRMTGKPLGFSGGKEETTISSTQPA